MVFNIKKDDISIQDETIIVNLSQHKFQITILSDFNNLKQTQ